MNAKKYLASVLLMVGIAACNNNSADPDFTPQSSTSLTDTLKDTIKSIPGINIPEKNPAPVTAPTTSSAPTTTSNTNTSNPALNPEHGQPGHRCDIAVGAPLNSKPAAITQQIQPATPNKPQPVTNIPQPVTAKTTTAPGMNPPHGEPGHRCDIAVGTPLNQPVKSASAKDSGKK